MKIGLKTMKFEQNDSLMIHCLDTTSLDQIQIIFCRFSRLGLYQINPIKNFIIPVLQEQVREDIIKEIILNS